MYYTVYKTTNSINGKIYIGKHETNVINDDYMGSGTNIKRALKKHGKDKFNKEILFIFETEIEMNDKEKELVTEVFCLRKDTYNICPGGNGGFGYINSNKESEFYKTKKKKVIAILKSKEFISNRTEKILNADPNFYSTISIKGNIVMKENFQDPDYLEEYKKHHKQCLPENHQKGDLNSQFGKKFKFMNNGIKNIKVETFKIEEFLALGFVLGRLVNPLRVELR